MYTHSMFAWIRREYTETTEDCVEHKMPKYVVAGSEGCMVTRAVILCELWAVVPMT